MNWPLTISLHLAAARSAKKPITTIIRIRRKKRKHTTDIVIVQCLN